MDKCGQELEIHVEMGVDGHADYLILTRGDKTFPFPVKEIDEISYYFHKETGKGFLRIKEAEYTVAVVVAPDKLEEIFSLFIKKGKSGGNRT